MIFDIAKRWLRPHPCVSFRESGSPCHNKVGTSNTRCERCWNELAASENGLLRVRLASELRTVAGVSEDAFARLINDPVTAVRVAVIENTPVMSSGWQEHAADDPEVVVWRALAQRDDIAGSAATRLLSNNDDVTIGFLIENKKCPVSVLRWVAANKQGGIQEAAISILEEPLNRRGGGIPQSATTDGQIGR